MDSSVTASAPIVLVTSHAKLTEADDPTKNLSLTGAGHREVLDTGSSSARLSDATRSLEAESAMHQALWRDRLAQVCT